MQFDLDFGDIRQYFPISLVLPGIFKICQDLFGESKVWTLNLLALNNFFLLIGSRIFTIYLFHRRHSLLTNFSMQE